MKPITPEECKKTLPDFVIESVNECIKKNYRKDSFIITQNELVDEILKHHTTYPYCVFKNHWLDIEETYREAGWEVKYEKPGYNEQGSPYFKFSKAIKLYDL